MPVDAASLGDTGMPPPGTSCTPRDAAVATGPKFCDLPGASPSPLTVPEGFCAREFTAAPVIEGRVMRFAPNGDLFLAVPAMGTPGGASGGAGAIVVLPDDNHDGRADAVVHYAGSPTTPTAECYGAEGDASNLTCVHGLLFSGGYLYYTRSDEVRRFAYKSGDRQAKVAAGELVSKLGGGGNASIRWTHTLDQAKDGRIYVSRGRFEASGCTDTEMTLGSVFALPVGSAATLPLTPEVVADGFRNPMFLRCQPGCGDCYADELSGDSWSGIGGREKLALLETNGHWGYPCCIGKDEAAPGAPSGMCHAIGTELAAINLHDTPFGLDFETGAFPAPYSYGVFIGMHGAVGSWTGTGVAWLSTDPVTHRPVGVPRMFATGWGQQAPVVGRAADVAFAPDGRLFVSDDQSGRIFWIAPKSLSMN